VDEWAEPSADAMLDVRGSVTEAPRTYEERVTVMCLEVDPEREREGFESEGEGRATRRSASSVEYWVSHIKRASLDEVVMPARTIIEPTSA
jgi:hypothetical protein